MNEFSRVFGFPLSADAVIFVKYTGSLTPITNTDRKQTDWLAEIDSIDGLAIDGRTVSMKDINGSLHELLVEAAYEDADGHISEILDDFQYRKEMYQ